MAATNNITLLLSSLIAANHILDFNQVADAFGHVSVRNPANNATFFLSKNQAPALVSSRADMIEYFVANGTSVDPDAPAGYAERFIHSEALRRFPAMNSVVHAHSPALVPFSLVDDTSGLGLASVYGVAGFLGTSVPNFDIATFYNDSHTHDMLVDDTELGAALASAFTTPQTNNTNSTTPDHAFVLMRGHGFTTMDVDIQSAVYRAVYAQSSANVQTAAMGLALGGGTFQGSPVKFLDSREANDSATFNQGAAGKPWALWVRQTEVDPLYTNELGSPLPPSS